MVIVHVLVCALRDGGLFRVTWSSFRARLARTIPWFTPIKSRRPYSHFVLIYVASKLLRRRFINFFSICPSKSSAPWNLRHNSVAPVASDTHITRSSQCPDHGATLHRPLRWKTRSTEQWNTTQSYLFSVNISLNIIFTYLIFNTFKYYLTLKYARQYL